MRIRSVFLLSITLGSAVGLVAALLFALQQWSAFQSAQGAQHDTRLLVSALHLPEMMNLERAFINARLVAPVVATPAELALIQRQTEQVDTILSDTRRLATSPADTAALQSLETKLLEVRKGALSAITRPQIERPAAFVGAYLQQMFAIQEAAYDLAGLVHVRINASNPDIGAATRLALLAWDMRDWSGRQTTTLISYIGLHLPMAGEQAETLAWYKGRIEQKWVAARTFAAQVDNPEVTAALAGVERGFWAQGGEAYSAQVVPNRGRTLDLVPDKFSIFIRPILNSILPLRDSALKEALRQSDADIIVRRTRFRLALGLLLLTACAAAAATRWFDLRVVRPVERITTIILGLASGDRHIEVPLRGRTDELGQMARAIEALRCNAVQAEVTGHEMLALQKARADEKSLLLTELTRTNEDLATLNLELESLAATDALTGIPNRRSFDLLLVREWRRAQREESSLGLLLLDVDHFKSFNDRYGHPAGDICLARVAASIANSIRRPGDTAARYGGEEFVALLPTTELEGALFTAERVRLAVAALEIPHAGNPCGFVTISIGAAVTTPWSSAAPGALVQEADAALYAAKHAGRNRIATAPGTAVVQRAKTMVPASGHAVEAARW
jgi:diguanylate cyclase (GGDEF)-like protein